MMRADGAEDRGLERKEEGARRNESREDRRIWGGVVKPKKRDVRALFSFLFSLFQVFRQVNNNTI